MRFDANLAEKIAQSKDRDRALFFAGRQKEIDSFAKGLTQAADSEQAVLRIFQGAPGCGKTSIGHQLKKKFSRKAVFAQVAPTTPFSAEWLAKAFKDSATSLKGKASNAIKDLVEAGCNRILGEPLTDAVANMISSARSKGAALVVHIDEAHALPESHELMLRTLHQTGIEVPCVVLLTGLGRTKNRIKNIPGLSRPAADATREIGALEHECCVHSSRMMLSKVLGVEGDRIDALADLCADLSKGWPAHLHSAQAAVCEELIRCDGNFERVDSDRIKRGSDGRRFRYYDERVESGLLDRDKKLSCRIIAAISRKGELDGAVELGDLIYDTIASSAKLGKSKVGISTEDSADIYEELVDKGIVTKDRADVYSLAIPSMGDWASMRMRPQSERWDPMGC